MATAPFLPDEAKPADADIVSQYPAVERLFRDIIESWLLVDHSTDGEHSQMTLPERGSDPTNATDIGFLYTKNDGGDTELFYEDAGGNVVQITADGGPGPNMAAFPATTSMFFYQSAAPTGWTKDVASTLGNHALKLVTDVAWSAGSKGATAFDSVFGSAKTAGNTTLTGAQSGLPAHEHTYNKVVTNQSSGTIGDSGFAANLPISAATTGGAAANAASAHNHTVSLDLNHIQVIRATKD